MKTNLPFGNRIYTTLLIAVFFFVLNYNADAQVSSSYTFSSANADPNPPGVPLGSPTMLANGSNTVYPNIPIGFTFHFNGNNYTQLGISSNGFVWFGTTAPSVNVSAPISDATAEAGVISAYGQAMEESEGGNPIFGYETQGTAPNRTFTVEWYNFADQSIDDGNNVTDFYVILYECTGVIKTLVNSNEYGWDGTSSGQVGLRGASNSDYFNREVDCGGNGSGWLNSIPGTSNGVTCTNDPCYPGSISGKPCTYTYTPTNSPGVPSISCTDPNTACTGVSVGVPVTISNGTAPYSINWSFTNGTPAPQTGNASNISSPYNGVSTTFGSAATASYDITVTDANGCPGTCSGNITVTACGSNTITTGSISSPICTCNTVSVPFQSTGTFNTGNNYTAQLSDQNGSFASPVTIGSIQATTANSGTISTTIPCNTTTGTNYRIRVVSSNPATTGSDNGADITINQPGNAGVVSASKSIICQNTVAHLTVTGASGSIQWQSSSDSTTGFTNISGATASSYSSNPISQNTYYRALSGSGSCVATSVSLQITVIPAPVAAFNFVVNGQQVTFNAGSSTGATSYFWDFDDDSTSTVENPVHNYASTRADTFHVCLTVKNNSSCTFTTCLNVYTFPTGVNNISGNNVVWQIYPDPFGNQLYIGTGNATTTVESIEMYDVLGRRIYFKEINGQMNNPMKLDLPNITAGVYFLKIEAKDGNFIKKVIKQ